jgi:hypothetical protein
MLTPVTMAGFESVTFRTMESDLKTVFVDCDPSQTFDTGEAATPPSTEQLAGVTTTVTVCALAPSAIKSERITAIAMPVVPRVDAANLRLLVLEARSDLIHWINIPVSLCVEVRVLRLRNAICMYRGD